MQRACCGMARTSTARTASHAPGRGAERFLWRNLVRKRRQPGFTSSLVCGLVSAAWRTLQRSSQSSSGGFRYQAVSTCGVAAAADEVMTPAVMIDSAYFFSGQPLFM